MKTLIAILIILSFLQTSVILLDLVLLILICRSYLKTDSANLYLSFGFGLLISHLLLLPLGLYSILYLLVAILTELFTKSPLAGRSLFIIPVSLILLSFSQITGSLILHQNLPIFPKVFIEALLSLPLFYLLRFWEERFIVRKDIKLRV